MKKNLIKKISIISFLVLFALALSIQQNIIKLPFTAVSQFIFDFNVDDDRELVGSAHNVFVAKILEKIKNDDSDITPVTQFSAEVVYNIKGQLDGRINIQQEGGYKNGILYTVQDGDVILPDGRREGLLVPGHAYLFFTRSTPGENIYHMISYYKARKLISQDASLSLDELKVLAERDERVKELKIAYKNEILNKIDVKNNYTRNTYQSLSEEEKRALEAK